jgi:hypothetical protein
VFVSASNDQNILISTVLLYRSLKHYNRTPNFQYENRCIRHIVTSKLCHGNLFLTFPRCLCYITMTFRLYCICVTFLFPFPFRLYCITVTFPFPFRLHCITVTFLFPFPFRLYCITVTFPFPFCLCIEFQLYVVYSISYYTVKNKVRKTAEQEEKNRIELIR